MFAIGRNHITWWDAHGNAAAVLFCDITNLMLRNDYKGSTNSSMPVLNSKGISELKFEIETLFDDFTCLYYLANDIYNIYLDNKKTKLFFYGVLYNLLDLLLIFLKYLVWV